MRYQDVKSELIKHFATAWEDEEPAVPVNWPNEGDENEDGEDIDAEAGEWLRFRVLSSYSKRIAVGGQLRGQGGMVAIQVFTPYGVGDARNEDLCTILETIYETAHDNGLPGDIHLDAPDPISGRKDEDTQQYMSGRVIPFTFDHTP